MSLPPDCSTLVRDLESPLGTSALYEDFAVIDRLMYKFHNQQRKTLHFQRMRGLRRWMREVRMVDWWVTWAAAGNVKPESGEWQIYLDAGIRAVNRAREACLASVQALYQIVVDEYYVPFGMVCIAAAAKVFVLLEPVKTKLLAMQLKYSSGMAIAQVKPKKRRLDDTTESATLSKKAESGWESAVSSEKTAKFRRKLKKSVLQGDAGKADEIDDIFGK